MRLIDADELILHLNDFMLQESPVDIQDIESIKVSAVIKDCIKAIDEQLTAYDVDKVVEQLEDRSKEYNSGVRLHGKPEEMITNEAIEIVKGGGIDA